MNDFECLAENRATRAARLAVTLLRLKLRVVTNSATANYFNMEINYSERTHYSIQLSFEARI